MYPRVVIDQKKLYQNTKKIVELAADNGIGVYVVTKVHGADIKLAQVCLDAGAAGLADSRIQNLVTFKALTCPKILLRLPMHSEVEMVVEYADISFNSELSTIKKLNQAAKAANKMHKIVVMFDLGDLREGFLPEQVDEVIPQILKFDHIEIEGIAVNLTCYGGVIPTPENLGELVALANHIEAKYPIKLNIISGGNSSSIYLLENGKMPERINNLRIGEGVVLGREAAYGEPIEGTHDDAFLLEAEIVELKEKESLPKGIIGMDAFGGKPVFEDQGKMLRAIVAVGRQDVDHTVLIPVDSGIEILGASSDHMILNVTHAKSGYAVGDVITFKMEYGAMLKLFTSAYVDRVYLD